MVYRAVMWTLVVRLCFNVTPRRGVAFVLATIVSYLGHSRRVFQAPLTRRTVERFGVVVLAGLAANLVLAAMGRRHGLPYAAIWLIVFATVPMLNVLGHHLSTFAAPTTEPIG